METERKCEKHPESKFYFYKYKGKTTAKCKVCNVERVTETRRKNKRTLVERAGGKCVRCGYSKSVCALDFHHPDPNEKDFGLSGNGSTRSIEKAWVEAQKCLLLCANCHREEHERLRVVSESNRLSTVNNRSLVPS